MSESRNPAVAWKVPPMPWSPNQRKHGQYSHDLSRSRDRPKMENTQWTVNRSNRNTRVSFLMLWTWPKLEKSEHFFFFPRTWCLLDENATKNKFLLLSNAMVLIVSRKQVSEKERDDVQFSVGFFFFFPCYNYGVSKRFWVFFPSSSSSSSSSLSLSLFFLRRRNPSINCGYPMLHNTRQKCFTSDFKLLKGNIFFRLSRLFSCSMFCVNLFLNQSCCFSALSHTTDFCGDLLAQRRLEVHEAVD